MRIREVWIRSLVRGALRESLMLKRPGKLQLSPDRFIIPHEREIERLRGYRVRGTSESDEDYAERLLRIDADITTLELTVDRLRRRDPSTSGGGRIGLDQNSIISLEKVRDAKRRFDKNCEIARTGHRVRYHSPGDITGGILTWPTRAELPCHIFKSPPVAGYGPVLILLEGGVVTFADFEDMRSDAVFTASGIRHYPSDEGRTIDPSEKISISWDDVERAWEEGSVDLSLTGKYPDLGLYIEEALVVGSRPGAIIVADSIKEFHNMRSVDEIVEDISRADLPLVDKYLRLISVDGARKILEGS